MSRWTEVHGLTERQGEVVEAVIEAGSIYSACKQTGYDYATAKRLFSSNVGFQNAVLEALKLAQIEDALKARKVLRETMESPNTGANTRVTAAKDILDRGVGKAPDRVLHSHEHKHSLSRDELAERIGTLASELGISSGALLQSTAESATTTESAPAEEPKAPEPEPDPEPHPKLPRLRNG